MEERTNKLINNVDTNITIYTDNKQNDKDFLETIKEICQSFLTKLNEYNPELSLNIIQKYTSKHKNQYDNVSYSQINLFVFYLNEDERGLVNANSERLKDYVLNTANNDSFYISIKIYDHIQLALNQVENVKALVAESTEETKSSLQEQLKEIEKEYITILGIFSSIVLAFVGGATFSSSVLENINQASVSRLAFVITLLAFVLVNAIYLLVEFILKINNKQITLFNWKVFNSICVVVAVVLFIFETWRN